MCHPQEMPSHAQVEAAAEPLANAPAHVTDRSPDTDEPAVNTPGNSDAQPLPEEVLAAGLIPPHHGVSTSAETTEEPTAAAATTDTLSNELQSAVVQEAPQVQIDAPEVPAPSSTSKDAELDPDSTAALIQVATSAQILSEQHVTCISLLASSTIATGVAVPQDIL